MLQGLYRRFPLAGGFSVMPAFQINNSQRLTASKVFRSGLIGVLPKPSVHLGGNAGVQTVVTAKYDINRPVQGVSTSFGWQSRYAFICQHIRLFIAWISGMTFYPDPLDVVVLNGGIQTLPKINVFNRLSVCGFPVT